MPRLSELVPPRFFYLFALIIIALLPLAALAADSATPATVNVGWFAAFAAEYIAPALGLVVSLGLGHVYVMLKSKFGVDIDASQRDALQTAITNAAGLLVAKGVHMTDGKTIDVGNPLIAQAVKYAQDAAPGALKHFGLGADDVAQKIVAKIGVLTAPTAPAAPAQ